MSGIISFPKTTVNIVAADSDVSNTPQKVLFVGQKLVAGSATSGVLVQNIGNSSADIEALAGAGSMSAEMLIMARKTNQKVQFDSIFLDDNGSATAAAKTITITGTATESGSIDIVLSSRKNYTVTVPVTSGDTATVVGVNADAQIDSDAPKAPYTPTNAVGVLTLTAKNGGIVGNTLGVEVSGSVAGLTFVVASSVSGLLDPVLTSVLDVIGEQRYQTIVWPYASDITTIKTFLDARFNVDDDILDGIAIIPSVDTLGNLTTLGNAHNSQSIVIVGDEVETTSPFIGPANMEISYGRISELAAIRSLRYTEGASIAQFVISRNGSLDSFGGPALASKPYANTPLPNLSTIDTGKGFEKTEIATLNAAGITVFGNNRTSTSMIVGQIVTTYKTDIASNPDDTYKYLNYVDTSSQVREYFSNNLKSNYAQSRLTEGGLIRGRDMANDISITAFLIGLYSDLSGPDFVLLQEGEDALQFVKQNLSVVVDLSLGRATVQLTMPLVTQLREILATMKISFSTNG